MRPLSSSAKRTFGVTRGNITGQPRSWQIPPTRRACRHHHNNTTKPETPVFTGICSPASLPGRSQCARGRCSPARTPTHPPRFPDTTSAGIIHMRGCSDVPPIPDRRTRWRGQHTRALPTCAGAVFSRAVVVHSRRRNDTLVCVQRPREPSAADQDPRLSTTTAVMAWSALRPHRRMTPDRQTDRPTDQRTPGH